MFKPINQNEYQHIPSVVFDSSPSFSIRKTEIKNSGTFIDGNSIIPAYHAHGPRRGEVLIINNIMYSDKSYRQGAVIDGEKMEDLFEKMGFSVTAKQNLKKDDMEKEIEKFSKKSSDIAIMVVMSHGTKTKKLTGREIFDVDDQRINIEDLLTNFTENKCKNLVGKPKIFIFQCCSKNNKLLIPEENSKLYTAVADTLIAYSTLEGFSPKRSTHFGTLYISALCEVFKQHAHEQHIEDLLKMTTGLLTKWSKHAKYTTYYENRGFKHCYLNPL